MIPYFNKQKICQYDLLRFFNTFSTRYVHFRTIDVRIQTEANIPHLNIYSYSYLKESAGSVKAVLMEW